MPKSFTEEVRTRVDLASCGPTNEPTVTDRLPEKRSTRV